MNKVLKYSFITIATIPVIFLCTAFMYGAIGVISEIGPKKALANVGFNLGITSRPDSHPVDSLRSASGE